MEMPSCTQRSRNNCVFILGSIWIPRAKEEFELPEYQELLKEIGVEGEWEGIGHCAVGYVDGEFPKPAKRKDNRVFWVD